MIARRFGSWVVAATVLVSAPGAASGGEPDEAAIQWSAPPECPGAPALRTEIERLIGRPLLSPGRPIQVEGEVTRDPGAGGRYRLRLTIAAGGGPHKERRLDGGTCALVTSAAAVVVALAVDAEPAPEEPAPPPLEAPPPQPHRPSSALPVEDPPTGSGRASPAAAALAWEIAVIGGVDAASLPAPAAGVGFRVAQAFGADRIELQAAAWLSRRATLPALPSAGADVSLYAAGLRYCRRLLGDRLDLAPCGGLEAGAIVASGFGAAPSTTGVGRWLAPQIGLAGVARPTPRFALSLEIDGLALVFRDRFAIQGAGLVYRPPPATLRAIVGAAIRFP